MNNTFELHWVSAPTLADLTVGASETRATDAWIGYLEELNGDDMRFCYSFGVVLWEAATRRRPWAGKSQHQIHNALVRGERLPVPGPGDGAAADAALEVFDVVRECFGAPEKRPCLDTVSERFEDLIEGDVRDLERMKHHLAEAQRGDADAYDEAWEHAARDPKAGAVDPLVALLQTGTDGAKEQAAKALRNLAIQNADNKVAIAKAGAVDPLVALLQRGTDGVKKEAAVALKNLANRAESRVAGAQALSLSATASEGDVDAAIDRDGRSRRPRAAP